MTAFFTKQGSGQCGDIDVLTATKREILAVSFDLIDYREAFQRIEHWRQTGQRQYVALTNPHRASCCAVGTKDVACHAQCGDDSAGRHRRGSRSCHILGYANRGGATGPTLMLKLCDWGRERKYRHFFLGSRRRRKIGPAAV